MGRKKHCTFLVSNEHLPNGVANNGLYNGYVAVAPTNKHHGKPYSEVQFPDVKELDFSESIVDCYKLMALGKYIDGKIDDIDDDWWVFGFSTTHCDDNAERWTFETVSEEAKKLTERLCGKPKKNRSSLATSLSVSEINRIILKHHGGCLRVLAVPNVIWNFTNEADLIVLSNRGYATEYEIKRSWSDFKKDFQKRPNAHLCESIYNFAYVVPEKIIDKVTAFLDERYTEYDYPCVYAYSEDMVMRMVCGKLHPRIREVNNCRKMTLREQFNLARLGVIRYWNATRKP
ncbi:MAG: hypothetical protein LUD72_07415 [Bacteroidales bacterium]|nr:hypothetical protein [Bacteroidales bacterium]